jgi:hypothetical protein
MLGLITELNETLPEFGAYLQMFPKSPILQAHLQDIYNTYMEYCISSIRYMKRSPSGVSSIRSYSDYYSHANRITVFFITYLFGSDPAASIKKAKEDIKHHMRLFERAAKLSIRQQNLMQNIEKEFTASPLTELPKDITTGGEDDIKFPINTVTMIRNFTFVGRDQELRDIREALSTDQTAKEYTANNANLSLSKYGQGIACCILQGLGGIGKTQTALEFTYTYRENYDAIFWISAEMDSSMASEYASIARMLGLMANIQGDEGENHGRAIERTKTWLSNTGK